MPVVLVVPCTPHSLRVAVAHPVEEEWREGGREGEGREREKERGRERHREREKKERGRERDREREKERRRRESKLNNICVLSTVHINTHPLSV